LRFHGIVEMIDELETMWGGIHPARAD